MATDLSSISPGIAAWARMNMPGPMHEHFRPLVGTWLAVGRAFCDPQGPPQESTGTMRTDLLMGGRYLHSTYTDNSKQHPFSGILILAYNNILGRYESTWIDSMSTGVMFSTGSADPMGRVFTLIAEVPDPATGMSRRIKSVTSIINHDRNTYHMYEIMPGGSERMTLDVVYTRKR